MIVMIASHLSSIFIIRALNAHGYELVLARETNKLLFVCNLVFGVEWLDTNFEFCDRQIIQISDVQTKKRLIEKEESTLLLVTPTYLLTNRYDRYPNFYRWNTTGLYYIIYIFGIILKTSSTVNFMTAIKKLNATLALSL